MKRLLLCLCVIAVCGASASAISVQREKPVTGMVGAGVSPLTGDFGDYWNMGFHGLVGFGINVAPNFRFMPKFEYESFGLDKQGLPISGGTLTALMATGDLVVEIPMQTTSARPFFLGGFGIANVSMSDVSGGDFYLTADDETKLCLEFGGGISFKASPTVNLFFMARYVSISTEGSSLGFVPLTFGVQF